MKKEVALVLDRDGNERYFGETEGECQRWCKENNIDGSNGEYIAFGLFDTESRYFEADDYAEINNLTVWG